MSLLDLRIETQKKIIEKYESLIKGLCQKLFVNRKYDSFVYLGNIAYISNGNSDVKDASMVNDGGMYPFFDRSNDIKYLPEYLFDAEAIIYPGEGAEFYPRYYNGKFALHQRCYAIYDISSDFIPRYLYHYCKTQNSYFVRNAVGSTVASLRLDTFKRLKVPAIPIHTQESLVQLLDKVERKLECNKVLLIKYEEQKKSLLSNLFI
jgi:type I restriction enzyme S subunit